MKKDMINYYKYYPHLFCEYPFQLMFIGYCWSWAILKDNNINKLKNIIKNCNECEYFLIKKDNLMKLNCKDYRKFIRHFRASNMYQYLKSGCDIGWYDHFTSVLINKDKINRVKQKMKEEIYEKKI
jgi:hypothetical protein